MSHEIIKAVNILIFSMILVLILEIAIVGWTLGMLFPHPEFGLSCGFELLLPHPKFGLLCVFELLRAVLGLFRTEFRFQPV